MLADSQLAKLEDFLILSGCIHVSCKDNICSECELVEQIWIYGNSYENFLVAVVIPDEKQFKSFASQNGGEGSSTEELCKDSKASDTSASISMQPCIKRHL